MMVDIFSSLDAGGYSGYSTWGFIWFSGFLGLVVSYGYFWVGGSSVMVCFKFLLSLVNDLVKDSGGKMLGGFVLGECCLFLFIFILNVSGMVPGVFGPTSHLSFTIMVGLVMWFCLIMSGWVYSWKEGVGLLVPTGAPGGLVPLLVLIESVTLLGRPITLGIRLAVNISMGHLMLHVLGEAISGFVSSCSVLGWFFGSMFVSGYIVFEFVVSFLQAYVFVLLLSLYSSDHSLSKH
uniref:ATP synthase subunit a n=1 Tax=Anodontites trapesialis TaxID=1961152 RepID=A0A1Y9T622_9BIVA|nr:ATP synthase F0 subunit 6 [Anodontites trapesialis]